jgi:hypothetical protein
MNRHEYLHTGEHLVMRGHDACIGVVAKIWLGAVAELNAGTSESVLSPLGAGGRRDDSRCMRSREANNK